MSSLSLSGDCLLELKAYLQSPMLGSVARSQIWAGSQSPPRFLRSRRPSPVPHSDLCLFVTCGLYMSDLRLRSRAIGDTKPQLSHNSLSLHSCRTHAVMPHRTFVAVRNGENEKEVMLAKT